MWIYENAIMRALSQLN